MPTILSFLSGRQITNDSGVPQTGAKVYHYRATTTTDLTVWQLSDATVPHAQPVVTDAGGFVPLIYVDDTFNWKIVVTTAADVILPQYNFDNLEKAESASPAATYSFAKFPWEQVSAASSPVILTAADAGKAYEADTTGGNVEFDLPPAGSVPNGAGFIFKKTVAANSMIIDPSGSETIDNASASLTITQVNSLLGIYSNVAEWYRVNSSSSLAIQAFTASGTYTPTPGMTHCLAISTGAGGGGGGADAAANGAESGGGGGAGATCLELFSAATIGASQAVTIGAGGTAGALTGGNGGVGGNTTFGALHTAGGGAGGIGVTTASTGIGAGGAGGTATGSFLDILGGGGNSGQSDNTNNVAFGGQGGSSFWGGSGVPPVRIGTGVNAGVNGSAYGSGATGGVAVDDITGAAGGVGAPGVVFVFELVAA